MARVQNGRAALTDDQVRVIKQNLILGVPCSALARQYRVGEETIGRIRRGLTYRHVEVKGEEVLRPACEVAPLEAREVRVLTGMTEGEEEERAAESFAELQRQLGLSPEVVVERTLEGEGP